MKTLEAIIEKKSLYMFTNIFVYRSQKFPGLYLNFRQRKLGRILSCLQEDFAYSMLIQSGTQTQTKHTHRK